VVRAFLVLAALVIASAAYGEDVGVRGWSHAKFGRLVFDWPVAVTYTAQISGRRLTVNFNKPVSTQFSTALQNLREYISNASLARNGRTVRFSLAGDFSLRSFKNDNAIVLDMRRIKNDQARISPLAVRVGEHPNYTRLVFDWKGAVDYEAALIDGRLQLRFDKSAVVQLGALNRQLPQGFGAASASNNDSGLVLNMPVPGAPRLRHFRSGTKVVVDLLVAADGAKSVATPTASASPKPAPPKTSRSELLDTARKAIANAKKKQAGNGPKRLLPKLAPAAEVLQESSQTVEKKAPADDVAPKKDTEAKTASESAGTAASEVKASQKAVLAETAEAAGKPNTTNENLPSEAALAENATSAVKEATPKEAVSNPKGSGFIAKAFREAKSGPSGESASLVSLIFEWPEPVGAAVFARAGFIWVLFDKRATINLAPLRAAGKGLVSRIEQLPVGNATVLRMVPADGMSPYTRRDGTNWVVDFQRGRIRPEIQIGIDADSEAEGGARIFFPAVDTGTVIRLPDPEVGDLIQAATIKASGHGIQGQRAYPEFQILASAQGLAVVGLNDDVELDKASGGLVLSAPDGLHISGVSPDAGVGRTGKSGRARRIFKLAQWRDAGEKDYFEARQKLQEAVSRQPRQRRDKSRLRLAQFYFARGLGPEAKGVLQVFERSDAGTSTTPEFKALKGAVAALNNELDVAARNLSDPRLDKFEEVSLWRGVTAARSERWKQAQLLFKQGDSVLHGYPNSLKEKLGLLRVETALKARDSGSAGRWLKALDMQAEGMSRGDLATLRYLQGRHAFVEQDIDRASDLWSELRTSGDTWNAARAELSLVNMGLLQNTIEQEEAIERLERLRFKWRGDELEMQILRRLGGLYLDRNDYRGGLGTYRVIATYFPSHQDTKRIAQTMTDTFKKLYLDGNADELPPLTALALYDEFRELTPAGQDGNQMIQKLSERLVKVDLLNRAADLLEHQVKFRLQGEERAQVGAKLALIRLLDRNPKKAVEALRMTVFPRLPEQLGDDRRRIQARATFEIGEVDKAVELLAGDVSRNADLLRADIQWKSENWGEAAKVLQRLAGDPPSEGTTFDRSDAQVVLNWAVALRLDSDESGLEVVRALYGSAMAASPLSKAFQFIASASSVNEPLDLETITTRIADDGVFDAFLTEYLADNKKRLLGSPVAPVQPPATAPATPPQATAPDAAGSRA